MTLNQHAGSVMTLTVARNSSFGYFLTDGNEDVLLHMNETDQELEVDDKVEVFLYVDSRGRLAATTKIPDIRVGIYGWAEVESIKPGIGVFINIGIQKDILLGEDDLPAHRSVWPEPGDWVYMTLRMDRNNLLYAKIATDPIIQEISRKATRADFNKNVEGHVYRTAKVGTWVYTIDGLRGFVHESQRKKEPRLGEKVTGRIIDVKEDGTVNISLLPRKQEAMDEDTERVFTYLLSRNGAMPYWDKSMSEDIQERFGMSKSSFKRALGRLMKDGKVYQEEGWTYLKKE